MINDAELHADEDQKKRENVELKNNAQGTIFAAETMLKDNEDKISDLIDHSISAVLNAGHRTKDIANQSDTTLSCDEMGDLILGEIKKSQSNFI